MSAWPAVKASRVLAALLRIGWTVKRTAGSHRVRIGRNAVDDTELAGATFSPDGKMLFLNLYGPGLTRAITGPWPVRAA